MSEYSFPTTFGRNPFTGEYDFSKFNSQDQYDPESLSSCLNELYGLHDNRFIIMAGYLIDGRDGEMVDLYGKTRYRGFTHTIHGGELQEDRDVNYFSIMKDAYEYFHEDVVLVYGMVFPFTEFKQMQIRNYCVRYDGKVYSFHPLYEEDDEVRAKLVLPV